MLKFAAAISIVVGIPAVTNAQLQAAPLPDIYESYNDCFAATANGIDGGKLEAKGWKIATNDGKPTSNPVIYGHAERSPLIMLNGQGPEGMCAVIARLENDAAFNELVAAWKGLKFNEKGEAMFMAEGHPVLIAKTGSKDAPSVRLVVGPTVEQN